MCFITERTLLLESMLRVCAALFASSMKGSALSFSRYVTSDPAGVQGSVVYEFEI
jgi:hypothetical protein